MRRAIVRHLHRHDAHLDQRDHLDSEALEARLSAYGATRCDPEAVRAAFSSPSPPPPPPAPTDTFAARFPTESLFAPSPQPAPVRKPRPEPEAEIDLRFDVDRAAAVLGVHPDDPWTAVVRAHRELAWIHHPDLQLGASPDDRAAAEEAMRDLNLAYTVLRRRNSRLVMAD